MATRSSKRAAKGAKSGKKTPDRSARKTGARPAQKTQARAGKKAARVEKRRRTPETLRLRSLMPSFTVDDLTRSLAFYTDVLGFVVSERWEEGGQLKGVMLKAGVCELGLSQDDWAKGRDRKKGLAMSLWCQTAQDVNAIAGRIRLAGGRLTQEPKDESWGGRSLGIEDPDGFRLTIYQPDEKNS
jgi:catechol 2,3-dioxygenase-like lactoylglutathione lyase family enzyme